MQHIGKILVISSYVVSGQVGLKAAMPALRALNLEVVSLPSTILAAHPAAYKAHGAPAGGALPVQQMRDMADWLINAGALDDCAAVITGYLPSLAHIDAAAQIIHQLKARAPDIIYCCDPVCGDDGRLYLPESVVDGLRDTLLPMADIATPNLFELHVLSGRDRAMGASDNARTGAETTGETIAAARALNLENVIVTSAPAPQGRIATLAVGAQIYRCETACAPHAPHGMGDFFAALYMGLKLADTEKALGIACATLFQIAAQIGVKTGDHKAVSQLPHGPVTLAPPAISDKITA